MTQHALFIDAGCQVNGKGGTLNHAFVTLGRKTLEALSWSTDVTLLDEGWSVEDEVQKILKADLIVIQTPGWWMSTPWQLKKYQDEVFVDPRLCGGDGRSRLDPSKRYGSGGFLKEKHYFISSTWNAPLEAFNDPDQFFEGRGIDGVLFPLHKAMEFLGFVKEPSFVSNDVFKNPTIENDMVRYEAHLRALAQKLAK